MPSAAHPPKASRHSALCSLLTEDSRLDDAREQEEQRDAVGVPAPAHVALPLAVAQLDDDPPEPEQREGHRGERPVELVDLGRIGGRGE